MSEKAERYLGVVQELMEKYEKTQDSETLDMLIEEAESAKSALESEADAQYERREIKTLLQKARAYKVMHGTGVSKALQLIERIAPKEEREGETEEEQEEPMPLWKMVVITLGGFLLFLAILVALISQ